MSQPAATPILPFDVVDLIVDECLSDYEHDRWDYAKALSLTSRGLRERAQPLLWEQVDLPETSRGWDSQRLRAINTTPRIADMVTRLSWAVSGWDEPPMPDWVLPHVEQLFHACRNISHIYLSDLLAVHFPRVLDAIRASKSRSTLTEIEIFGSGAYKPADFRLTEADLQLFLLSFPSLTRFSIDFFVNPPSLASSQLLNLRTCDLNSYPLPGVDEPLNPYQSLLHSINPRTFKTFRTWCMSHLDWLCHPGFSLNTISLYACPFSPSLLLLHLTRLLPFHPNLHHLAIRPHSTHYTPCKDSTDLIALRQILSILPPTLRTLDLPFAIRAETIPIQQLITDSPCQRLVLWRCWDSTTDGPFWLGREDETADWQEYRTADLELSPT
ncbi:hypothetical protein JCM1840_004490 [Sporobolomyces johnsonii]